jgi:hypothetical protein
MIWSVGRSFFAKTSTYLGQNQSRQRLNLIVLMFTSCGFLWITLQNLWITSPKSVDKSVDKLWITLALWIT